MKQCAKRDACEKHLVPGSNDITSQLWGKWKLGRKRNFLKCFNIKFINKNRKQISKIHSKSLSWSMLRLNNDYYEAAMNVQYHTILSFHVERNIEHQGNGTKNSSPTIVISRLILYR